MKKALTVGFVLIGMIFAAFANAAVVSTNYLLTEKTESDTGYVVAKVVSYDTGEDETILEVTYNGRRWTKELKPYVYPRIISFPTSDTAIMLTYEWLGNNTGIYYFNLKNNRSFKKWILSDGGPAKFLVLQKNLLVGVTGLDDHFNQVKRVYLIEDYTMASSTPVLLKEFPPEIADIHFGYQQKGATYYGFAVMTVETSSHQAFVHRITDGVVESAPSGYRQLTYWSQVENFKLIDGFGLVARISELTFD